MSILGSYICPFSLKKISSSTEK